MKISVIIPVYNKAGYLNDILHDLSKQTFTDYECILVDDGSSDNSGEICDNISKTDNRFRTFHLKNGGVSNARNYGIKQSKGEYITFVDADDRLYPEHLSNLFRCITENQVDFVISGLEKYWMGSEKKEYVLSPCLGKINKEIILPQFAEIQRDTGIFGFCVAKIFRKELIKDIEFDSNLKLAEDFDFYLKVYRKIRTFYFDNKCYYRYLQFADNSSTIVEDDQIDYLMQLKIRLRYKDFLIEEETYEKENKKIIDEMINNFVYFVLFHSSKEKMHPNFLEMKRIINSDMVDLKGKAFFQKLILFLFKKNQFKLITLTLFMRRKLSELVHKIK